MRGSESSESRSDELRGRFHDRSTCHADTFVRVIPVANLAAVSNIVIISPFPTRYAFRRFAEDTNEGEEAESLNCVKALHLLREMARVDKAKKILVEMYGVGKKGERHVVMGIVFAMTAPRATPEVREAAVCALSNLALVEELRSAFSRRGKRIEDAKTVTAVHGLLAIGRAHKTEVRACES